MNLPGFNAEASLYRTRRHYAEAAAHAHAAQSVTPQQLSCPAPGTCAKASRLCTDVNPENNWCHILDRCLECAGG